MKNIITLNIGLNDTDNQPINVHTACSFVKSHGFEILASRVFDSPAGNEKCLVASCQYPLDEVALYHNTHTLARALRQDCIAIFHGGKGDLIGPNAEAWGEFNPAFFVTLSGLTLAENTAPTDSISEAARFVKYLEHTLIPDLKESGHEATAEDFETLISHYRNK